ncbi:hypothetical protein DRJ54_01695 [Candidatus Acetothermia bacterium]|nr:MAG: hypothetical protein DRJ54_01695 [Candidatus Acetothermia bacterium]
MAEQIAAYVVRELLGAGVSPEELLQGFRRAAERRLEEDAAIARELMQRVDDVEVRHAVEDDRQRLQDYLGIVERLLAGETGEVRTQVFPSWAAIDEATRNYVQISRMLRRRAVQSTWTRLVEAGYI